jgi:anthranilate synthase/aminodeoxychorismate synthase-like glutamine amidotransferase
MASIIFMDNFDSFTYNLVDLFRSLGHTVTVYRNSIAADTVIKALENAGDTPLLVLSPGPGTPEAAGSMPELIRKAAGRFPILGICLGHQAICQYYGGTVAPAGEIMHGKVSFIEHTGRDVFEGIPSPMPVARYHSLAATYVPDSLEEIASLHGICMAVLNRRDKVLGFQFHPESVMTTRGSELLINSIRFLTE